MDPTLTPYLCVTDGRAAIDWYVATLGARLAYDPVLTDDGRISHSELNLGPARWMVSDLVPGRGMRAAEPGGLASVALHLALGDPAAVDGLAARLEAAGTAMAVGPEDAGAPGRLASFRDPFGHWWVMTSG